MTFKKDLITGLSKKNKTIPSKYHYDLQGSKYFEKITQQKEYYPTRKEIEIFHKKDMTLYLYSIKNILIMKQILSVYLILIILIYKMRVIILLRTFIKVTLTNVT